MNAEKIIKLNKEALYTSIKNPDISKNFFNKSILHNAVIMEISIHNSKGISYEKLCLNIPKLLGSRSSVQNLLNEGLDKKLLKKVESKIDKRIKNFHLSEEMSDMIIDWVNYQKKIFNGKF